MKRLSIYVLGGTLLLWASGAALAHEDHAAAPQAAAAKPAKAKQVTVTGEIVDTGCYLGHAERGAKHQQCAQLCIRNGMPMGLLTEAGDLYRGESEPPRAPSHASRVRLFLIAALLLVVILLIAAYWIFRPNLTAAERGRRLAEASGCFGCHGPEGLRGTANPGRDELAVPNFEGTLMMYAESEQDVREWIRDGAPRARREDPAWKEARRKGVLRMPAYGRRLSERQIEDLVAFVMAVGALRAPDDTLPLHGRDRAEALGCFGCHGSGGRLARRNPGSLKGYVPPWDGADFTELVASEQEFREWVEEGVGRRFKSNPVAQFFLKRAPLKMPAYRNHLEPGDVEALWAYVQWLRAPRPSATTSVP